jgi:hypothetical protein
MRWVSYGILLAMLLLAACSDDSAQQTLVAENAALGTQISDIRATATFQRDVLQITVEALQLASTQVVQQNFDIKATMQATGVDPTAMALVRPGEFATVAATRSPQSAPIVGSVTPEIVTGTLDLTAIVPTETPGEPTLYNMVMADGVGDNDCALGSVTSFTSSAERIYIVATAANIAPGTVLGSQWFREGTLLVSPEYTPNFAINQNCIWFYVDQTDFTFTAGSYSVQMTINGTAVGQPIPFTITG